MMAGRMRKGRGAIIFGAHPSKEIARMFMFKNKTQMPSRADALPGRVLRGPGSK